MSAPAHKQPFPKRDEELDRYINLKLAALGLPVGRSAAGSDCLQIAGPLLRNYYQKDRQLGNWLCASDSRIQNFLDAYLSDVCPQGAARLPGNTFVLDREGMARVLSLPVTSDSFSSPYVDSYRLPQGVLHNPRSDKRTMQGLFHIAEGGLPIPADKAAVPKQAFAALWRAALTPPDDLLTLPFTADQEDPARCFVSLLLRPAGLSGRQRRPDLANPRELHLAQIAARLARGIPAARPVYLPVNAVLAGRRNNPADPKAGLPPLAAHSPIH